MNDKIIQVRMLGDFSVTFGTNTISNRDNRSHKAWLLLAYMLYFHNRLVPSDELMSLLWGNEESNANPVNSFKTMLHRVRSMLDQLGDGMGHTLIIRRDGCYGWNPAYEMDLDINTFETLCKASSPEEGTPCLKNCRAALALYQGDFLDRLSSEAWVAPISAYYRSLYIQLTLDTVALLEKKGGHAEIIKLCQAAMKSEPYSETLCLHLMQALLASGQYTQVLALYDSFRQLLLDNFGIQPCNEIHAVQREALRSVNDRSVSFSTIQEQLQEPVGITGALVCEYSYFKVLYHSMVRAQARTGDAAHIALFSLLATDGSPLAKRSLDCAMDNLQALLQQRLRKGDVISRCSASQFVVILPQANYENSCMVCNRIIKAFCRQYPHSPAQIRFALNALGAPI
jgi:DNA-binding SARP family transcriptional activator